MPPFQNFGSIWGKMSLGHFVLGVFCALGQNVSQPLIIAMCILRFRQNVVEPSLGIVSELQVRVVAKEHHLLLFPWPHPSYNSPHRHQRPHRHRHRYLISFLIFLRLLFCCLYSFACVACRKRGSSERVQLCRAKLQVYGRSAKQ